MTENMKTFALKFWRENVFAKGLMPKTWITGDT